MSKHLTGIALTTALAALAVLQPAAAQKRDPTDANAAVPALQYRSAFADYRANLEQPVGSWREANDTAGRVGGWRVYARQAREPEASAAASGPPARATAPSPAPGISPMAPAALPVAPTPQGHGAHPKP